jgi:pseudouridine-5'-phosphate glycosidase
LSVEVAAALASGQPVVALESTIISHGLPRPDNLELARALEAMVRDAGAVPATIAVLDGVVRIGLAPDDLERLAADLDIGKLSVRDLAPAIAAGISGATTVAATAHLAARAGIEVFATGGLGGVHPAPRPAGAQWDVSADLDTLARTPIAVVCSGVKSLLDVPATSELLETLGVPVIGYRTDDLPLFYAAHGGPPVSARVESAAEAAGLARAHWEIGGGGLLIGRPPDESLDDAEPLIERALAEAGAQDVRGQAVTPFVLSYLHRESGGRTLAANRALIVGNARLAGEIASAIE